MERKLVVYYKEDRITILELNNPLNHLTVVW